jgi:hypothetical protein
MLKKGASGDIYIHAWDITDEGVNNCFDTLEDTCGLNQISVGAVYHSGTFVLPRNPKRLVRWEDGSAFFYPQHPRWRESRLQPVLSECVDTPGYMEGIVAKAKRRDWDVLFFTVFHFSHSMAKAYPEACCVDALGERNRGDLCPANPDVRAYDLAIVEDLMANYGGDGIRHESLDFAGWGGHFVRDKVDQRPSPRDCFLLGLCFCGHCMSRARQAGVDPVPVRRAVRQQLYDHLSKDPQTWDMAAPDVEWARQVCNGLLWPYLEVRCDTVTSLFEEVQAIINQYDGAMLAAAPGNDRTDRDVLAALDYARIHPHLKRVTLRMRGDNDAEILQNLQQDVAQAPAWAEPELMHNQRAFASGEALAERLMLGRQGGVRHHNFHYYGMSRQYHLEWIGQARQAWSLE